MYCRARACRAALAHALKRSRRTPAPGLPLTSSTMYSSISTDRHYAKKTWCKCLKISHESTEKGDRITRADSGGAGGYCDPHPHCSNPRHVCISEVRTRIPSQHNRCCSLFLSRILAHHALTCAPVAKHISESPRLYIRGPYANRIRQHPSFTNKYKLRA